jgi:hypothetical protein
MKQQFIQDLETRQNELNGFYALVDGVSNKKQAIRIKYL